MTLPASSDWVHAAALVAGTFVSEDGACIAAGLLIHDGRINSALAVAACTLGIFLGDLGLWLIGYVFGRRVLTWRWVRARLPAERVDRIASWFDRRGWSAVLAARFLPGTRLPVFLAAGVLGRRAVWFATWALLAAVLWTPLLVLLVAAVGPSVVGPIERFVGSGWLTLAAALALIFFMARLVELSVTQLGRARLHAAVSRIWRWEFWPMWLFYLPLIPWIGWLALRRRGLATMTSANPGIQPHGGVVGESKHAILAKLPPEWVIPGALSPPGPPRARLADLQRRMTVHDWQFPLILKPDAGQRGAGVRLARDAESAERYLAENPEPVLAQVYHPGPFEAGVFYYRRPGEPRGRIFSVTDKHFPQLVGDGANTVESLIWRHPRFRMQAATFLARMNGQSERVLALGEPLPLAIAGNHCQGTLFRDGAHLITPELEASIDAIARHFAGFHFGRFDVRYADPAELRAGRGFSIIELNGVTSESTNLYDPSWSLLRAYGVLFAQWALLFQIGAENRARGHQPSSLWRVLADSRRYYRERRVSPLSD